MVQAPCVAQTGQAVGGSGAKLGELRWGIMDWPGTALAVVPEAGMLPGMQWNGFRRCEGWSINCQARAVGAVAAPAARGC